MSDLDLNRLLQGHVVLSAFAAFSNAPAWNIPLALVGLVLVPQVGEGHSAESVRQFVLALGGSVFLDFIWFVTNSTHGFVRIAILLNWLLKIVTVTTALSSLRARGEGSFGFPGGTGAGGFSIPGGLADRLPSGFPPFGQRQQQESETVWSAPPQQPHPGSYQPRFSIDEEASAGSVTPPPPPPTSTSGTGSAKKGGAGRKGPLCGEAHVAPEGGGYHSLE